MKFRVLIEQDDDGIFVAEVPSLPGMYFSGANESRGNREHQRGDRTLS